jgi:hypothetical protein
MLDLRFATTGKNNMRNNIEWSRYNNTLIDRGKLTFWIPEELEEPWYYSENSQKDVY